MCGIYGLVLSKNENIYELIINGLIQLQNRGYDSSGLSIVNNNNDTFEIIKYASTDTINSLEKLQLITTSKQEKNHSFIGMGHNRWATHGIKDDINAHPHLSNNKNFVIVHNGIIENYSKLKAELIQNGYYFISQTDTEVIVNLIEYNYTIYNDTFEAIKKTIEVLEGTYGLIIQSINDKNKLYCVRNGSPLLIGQNEDKVIVTSEQSGFCNMVKNYITLHNDDICVIEKKENNAIIINTSNTYLHKKISSVTTELSPQPFNHWTLKEINEQPNTVINAINKGGRIKNECEVKLGGLEQNINILKEIDNIIILGCGTSYFAGLYGMYYFKQICNFNTVQVFDGADFNDVDIPKLGNTGIILISQSGETKDLHRCISIAKNNSITTIGIINVVDSLIAREVDCGIYCNAGKEVGVASTKAFTSQVVCLSLISIWFAQIHNISTKKRIKMIRDLHNLSNDIKNTIETCENETKKIAKNFKETNMFLIGKGSDEYIAKEGSLKIKEISYIHSEGYSSSSLKHGPFALLDEHFPVIIINLEQTHKTKTLNCYQEVASRNSPIIFITNDISISKDIDCEILLVPENKTFASLLGIIPIQLLAYYLSIERGINPDKPKNLAKVVTVE